MYLPDAEHATSLIGYGRGAGTKRSRSAIHKLSTGGSKSQTQNKKALLWRKSHTTLDPISNSVTFTEIQKYHHEQDLGDGGNEKLPVKRQKPRTDPSALGGWSSASTSWREREREREFQQQ